MRFDHLRCVGRHDGNGVTGADTGSPQRGREAARAFVSLRPGIAPLAMNHRGVTRIDKSCAGDQRQRREWRVVGLTLFEMALVGILHRHGGYPVV